MEHPEQQPFIPIAPLTPISWDVDAAKAAGTQHPSGRPAPQAGVAGHTPETNASVKKALNKQTMLEGKWGARQKGKKGQSKKGASSDGGAVPHKGAEGKGRGGKGKGGKGKGRGKPEEVGAARVVFQAPSKDAKGGGKRRAK